MTARDPVYVPVTVQFDGNTWTSVGMRYKGNSTLMSATMEGTRKTPFRLDFDRYEDERPEIRNQRIYGFSKLTFSSNTRDASQLREVMATEVFRDRGVPAPRAAFYRVYVNTGSGAEYWGLYSMIEDPSDGPMLDAQFGSDSGNLYKPDGPGATWASFDAESFEKKNNKKQADWGDVSSAIAALNAPQTDRRVWRAALEAKLDVDHFLRWLAVNTAIDNWDVYGTMSHNYYLYADPAKKAQLRWIPWDNNEAFGRSGGPGRGGRGGPGGAPPRGGGGGDFFVFGPGGPPPDGQRPGGPGGPGPRFGGPGSNDDVMHARTGSQWPLIRTLLDDDVYAARYREHLRHALGGLFAPDAAARRLRELHSLISRAAIEDPAVSREAFEQSVDGPGGMIEFVKRRHELIRTAIDGVAAR
jgi:spore coat protein CotH